MELLGTIAPMYNAVTLDESGYRQVLGIR